jgi:hypothetical protein
MRYLSVFHLVRPRLYARCTNISKTIFIDDSIAITGLICPKRQIGHERHKWGDPKPTPSPTPALESNTKKDRKKKDETVGIVLSRFITHERKEKKEKVPLDMLKQRPSHRAPESSPQLEAYNRRKSPAKGTSSLPWRE